MSWRRTCGCSPAEKLSRPIWFHPNPRTTARSLMHWTSGQHDALMDANLIISCLHHINSIFYLHCISLAVFEED